MTLKDKAVSVLNSIQTGDASPLSAINPNKYIQHNPHVSDGVQGLKDFIAGSKPGGNKIEVVRAFEDGDYAFTHTNYNLSGEELVAFDVFRSENGQIVEHWDNSTQKTPPNPSNHTQTDGPNKANDLSKTEENKAFSKDFVETVLVNQNYDKMGTYFDGDNYIQHNSQIGDGLSGLNSALADMAKQGIEMEYDRIHKVLGEGSFTLVMSEGKFGGDLVAYYDLFRIENGKIAEHWDVISPIPAKDKWKNKNGKF